LLIYNPDHEVIPTAETVEGPARNLIEILLIVFIRVISILGVLMKEGTDLIGIQVDILNNTERTSH
jgi:hypothetical protein